MWHYIHDIQRTFLDFTHQMNTMEWGVFLLVVVTDRVSGSLLLD